MGDSEKNLEPAKYQLDAVIERFEDTAAIVTTGDGQQLRWPIKNLPENIEKGQAVRLTLSSAASELAEREMIAKSILNQILKKPN